MKYKILLVSFYNDEAYGLRILHSILHHQGHDAEMLFLKLGANKTELTLKEKKLFFDFLRFIDVDMVAFSLVSPNFMLYKSLYPEIRKCGDFKILLGGWQVTLNPNDCIPYCDYLCVGEGEEAVPELVNALAKKECTTNIKNVWSNTDGVTSINNVRPLVETLSKYPYCILQGVHGCFIENNEFVPVDPYQLNTRYGTIMGRGCPLSCSYCSNSFMSNKVYPKQWSRMRYRDIDHVIAELKQAKNCMPNLERINFYDEIFIPEKKWITEFFKRYKAEIDLPFYCMFYPGTCNDNLARVAKEAGLAGVWMGIQSGSERVRKEIYKRCYGNKLVMMQAEIFAEYKISAKYDFIFDNPFETKEEEQETIELMKALPEPKSFNLFSLKFFPNTDITQMALDKGLITQESLDDQLDIICPEYEVFDERKKQILKEVYSD